jgi:hypothetical protein
VWSEAIVGLERRSQGGGPVTLVLIRVGVGPELEQCADEALDLPIRLRPVGARLSDPDPQPGAPFGPAALEASAVVAEDPLDLDPVLGVEALELGEKGERRVGALVRVDAGAGERAPRRGGDGRPTSKRSGASSRRRARPP